MRDVWKEVDSGRGNYPIFISDVAYQKLDEEAAASYGMQVVNSKIGHQVGWTLLDEATFLVDLRICFPIYQLAFEITRPAAIFCPFWLDSDIFGNHKIYSLMLEHNGETIEIPKEGV